MQSRMVYYFQGLFDGRGEFPFFCPEEKEGDLERV